MRRVTLLRGKSTMNFMKKLPLYIFLFFSWFNFNNVLADQFLLSDIKLENKLTEYFTSAQISKYNINGKTRLPFYSYEGKYSMIQLKKKDEFFNDDYDYVQITYLNKNDEIHYISAVVDFQFDNKEGLNQCLNFKDKKLSEYKQNKTLIGLEKNITENFTHKMSGTKENGAWYENKFLGFRIGFLCLTYPKSANIDHDFRLDYHTFEANDWLQKKKLEN